VTRVAERAGISARALRNLESGNGSSLHTFCRVIKALGREEWLDTIAPVASINPLSHTTRAKPRQRASRPRKKATTFNEALAVMSDMGKNEDLGHKS